MHGTFNSSYALQLMAPPSLQEAEAPAPEATSRLLAPYTPQQPVPIVRSTDFPTIHTGEDTTALVPSIPGEPETLHVLPMYTRPRPIIPRYRIISGVISFFAVIGLLCGGSLYYAQVTGRLAFLEQLVNPQFQNLQPASSALLPTPSVQVQYASSSTAILSATTASSIDNNSQPQIPTNRFTVGQYIYVTYSVHAKTAGVVTFKWYTNGQFYESSPPESIPHEQNGSSVSDSTAVAYSRPAQGMVELYWNGVLNVTLYFVVEPDSKGGL
jgi:hypothetical protein